MVTLNKVYLMGGVVRDLELRYTSQGTAWGSTGTAVTRFWDNEKQEKTEKTDFIDLKFWGPLAEYSEALFRKGAKVFVEGYLRGESWDDRQTGQKRSKLVVVPD